MFSLRYPKSNSSKLFLPAHKLTSNSFVLSAKINQLPLSYQISGLVNNTGKPKTLNMPMDCNSIMGWPDQGDMARPARLHPMCGLLNHASLDMGRGKVHFIHVVYFCLTLGITLFPPSKRRVLSSIQDKMWNTNIGRELVIRKQLSNK